MSNIITVNDVRSFLWDRSAEDNQITGGLTFSDDEVYDGMKFAAREFNSIPPIGSDIDADCLPGDTNMFLDAIAMGLYIARLAQMSRNQIEYTAGSATVNYQKIQIAYMQDQVKMHTQRFQEAAKIFKLSCNLRTFYGIHDTIHTDGCHNPYGY